MNEEDVIAVVGEHPELVVPDMTKEERKAAAAHMARWMVLVDVTGDVGMFRRHVDECATCGRVMAGIRTFRQARGL